MLGYTPWKICVSHFEEEKVGVSIQLEMFFFFYIKMEEKNLHVPILSLAWRSGKTLRELSHYRLNLIIINFRQEFLANRKNWKP